MKNAKNVGARRGFSWFLAIGALATLAAVIGVLYFNRNSKPDYRTGLTLRINDVTEYPQFGDLLIAKEKKIGSQGPIHRGGYVFNSCFDRDKGIIVAAFYSKGFIEGWVQLTQQDLDDAREYFDFEIVMRDNYKFHDILYEIGGRRER